MTNPEFLEEIIERARSVAVDALPQFIGRLAQANAVAFSRLQSPSPAARQADELLDVDEAARRLGMGRDYLYRNHRKFSFTRREGRRLLFSANGIAEHIANPK